MDNTNEAVETKPSRLAHLYAIANSEAVRAISQAALIGFVGGLATEAGKRTLAAVINKLSSDVEFEDEPLEEED